MPVDRLNHLVLVVEDVDRSRAFYERALGLWAVQDGAVTSMHFPGGAIVLVASGSDAAPAPRHERGGSSRIGLTMTGSLADGRQHLQDAGVALLIGARSRVSSDGPAHSVFISDPDGNVLELAFPPKEDS